MRNLWSPLKFSKLNLKLWVLNVNIKLERTKNYFPTKP